MPQDTIVELLEERRPALLVTHTHADMDTLGAALGLEELLDGRVDVVTPDGVTARAQRLLEERTVLKGTDFDADSGPILAEYDLVVVLDTPTTEGVGPVDVESVDAPLALIDHHEPSDLTARATVTETDTGAGATAELVASLAERAGWQVPPAAALFLAAGILDDTGGLVSAPPRTFPVVGAVLDQAGDRAREVPALLERSPDYGERMATFKAVLRAEGYRVDRLLVAITQVGSHQSAATHALRDAGVDVAVVLSERGDRTWVVGRASDRALDRLHLPADLLEPLADELGGDGGGHDGAGVAKVASGDPTVVRARVLSRLETALGAELIDID